MLTKKIVDSDQTHARRWFHLIWFYLFSEVAEVSETVTISSINIHALHGYTWINLIWKYEWKYLNFICWWIPNTILHFKVWIAVIAAWICKRYLKITAAATKVLLFFLVNISICIIKVISKAVHNYLSEMNGKFCCGAQARHPSKRMEKRFTDSHNVVHLAVCVCFNSLTVIFTTSCLKCWIENQKELQTNHSWLPMCCWCPSCTRSERRKISILLNEHTHTPLTN